MIAAFFEKVSGFLVSSVTNGIVAFVVTSDIIIYETLLAVSPPYGTLSVNDVLLATSEIV